MRSYTIQEIKNWRLSLNEILGSDGYSRTIEFLEDKTSGIEAFTKKPIKREYYIVTPINKQFKNIQFYLDVVENNVSIASFEKRIGQRPLNLAEDFGIAKTDSYQKLMEEVSNQFTFKKITEKQFNRLLNKK